MFRIYLLSIAVNQRLCKDEVQEVRPRAF